MAQRLDFDDQLRRYFATADLDAIAPGALAEGIEQMRVDFGMEQDRGRRFALWTLMFLLGAAPDLDVAFKDAADRDAARDFMDLMDRAGGGSQNPPRERGGGPPQAVAVAGGWTRPCGYEASPLRQPCGLPPPRERGGCVLKASPRFPSLR